MQMHQHVAGLQVGIRIDVAPWSIEAPKAVHCEGMVRDVLMPVTLRGVLLDRWRREKPLAKRLRSG